MKKKPFVHASFVPNVNSTTIFFWKPHKTRTQQTVISAVSVSKSSAIGINKRILTPAIKVQNSITLS
jgi:hypothetical protein